MAIIGMTAVLVIILAFRLLGLQLPIRGLLIFILSFSVFPGLFWWCWFDGRLAVKSRHRARIFWAVYMLFMYWPVAVFLTGARHLWDALPVPAIYWIMIWHLLMVGTGWLIVLAAVAGYFRGLLCRLRRRINDESPDLVRSPDGGAVEQPDSMLKRRAFLQRVAFVAPWMVTGVATAEGLRQSGRFIVRRVKVKLERCPERLRGLTITHLSDLHVGRIFRPQHLPVMIDAVNQLKSDIVAITGDIIDHSLDFLPVTMDAFTRIEHRYGRFLVIGNHDLIHFGEVVIAELSQREPGYLSDRCVLLDIDGEKIQVAGLFWSRNNEAEDGRPGHRDRARTAMANADHHVFTLGLAHHPHAFDALTEQGTDLTLSGHTHGGQIMLTPPGSPYPIGGGSLFFRYIWGLYRKGTAAMYVTSGIGNWFPVRVNAPAEIVQIQLV